MHQQSENFNKEIENIFFKYQTEITEWRNTIIELKNTLQGFTSRLHETKERNKQGSRFCPIRKKSKKRVKMAYGTYGISSSRTRVTF